MENLTEFVNIQSDMAELNSKGLLAKLLEDKTTKGSIVWGTDEYTSLGEAFAADAPIRTELYGVIKTRVRKAVEQQTSRVKKHGEVFTPRWITDLMNDHIDEVWFGYKDPFKAERVDFKRKSWKRYVDSRRVEIACGEAPFLMTRYDVSTGVMIPVPERSGILDRKLRVVTENATDMEEWLEWALRSVQATYGYEFQGDNLLISRVNLLMTVEEFFEHYWQQDLSQEFKENLARIIAWNLWQMDGMTGMTPYFQPHPVADYMQNDLFSGEYVDPAEQNSIEQHICKTYDWRRDNSKEFIHAKEGERPMKFDFVIGNPPYQEKTDDTSDKSIYNFFMDEAYKVSDKVELITPARFLFNAGKTPKKWNEKMLNDEHFKVLLYKENCSDVFLNADIRGGLVITYRDATKKFGAIGTFTVFDELNTILHKVTGTSGFESFSRLIYAPESYSLTKTLHEEWPEADAALSKGHSYDLTTNIFEKLDKIFVEEAPSNHDNYIRIFGRSDKKRCYRWIKKSYIKGHDNLELYKVFLPKSNGSGNLGEALSTPIIGLPNEGHTQSFISIGAFETLFEAEACLKYLKSKFLRIMLGTLKVTQDNKQKAWKNVPVQNFTTGSDIDWAKSVPEIDRQLYKKYGLNKEEIEFIESHAKEMS